MYCIIYNELKIEVYSRIWYLYFIMDDEKHAVCVKSAFSNFLKVIQLSKIVY